MNLFETLPAGSNDAPLTASLYCDGGSRGNPGPAGCGGVLYDEKKQEMATFHKFLGEGTNNYAEYQGLIIGMGLALKHKVTDLTVCLDSKLAIEQMSGNWKVKHPHMKILWQEAKALEEGFVSVIYKHVRREKNTRADELANLAMDRG